MRVTNMRIVDVWLNEGETLSEGFLQAPPAEGSLWFILVSPCLFDDEVEVD